MSNRMQAKKQWDKRSEEEVEREGRDGGFYSVSDNFNFAAFKIDSFRY